MTGEWQKVYFQVDGNGFTELVRGIYQEGNRDKALALLFHVDGLKLPQAIDIIEGRKRFTGVGDEMRLVDDDVEVEVYRPVEKPLPVHYLDREEFDYEEEDEEEEASPPEPPKSEPPEPDAKLEAQSGYVTPDGKLYRCAYMGHGALAVALGYTYESPFHGVKGLLHLQDGKFAAPDFELTQAQVDVLFDWTQKHGKEMPWWWEELAEEG